MTHAVALHRIVEVGGVESTETSWVRGASTLPALSHDRYFTVVVVDNTVLSPLLLRPLEHGADFVMHSASKILGGHHDALLGVIACARAEDHERLASFRGATGKISPVLRAASDASGGFIASCRDPIAASYVRQHAALGGISIALELGMAITDAEPRGAHAILDAISTRLSGEILLSGKVRQKALEYTSSAFDVGQIHLDCGGQQAVLHVMNEYMAVECEGERLATYPTK